MRSELPIKANDHAMDATRYALHSALSHARDMQVWMRAWLTPRRRDETAER